MISTNMNPCTTLAIHYQVHPNIKKYDSHFGLRLINWYMSWEYRNIIVLCGQLLHKWRNQVKYISQNETHRSQSNLKTYETISQQQFNTNKNTGHATPIPTRLKTNISFIQLPTSWCFFFLGQPTLLLTHQRGTSIFRIPLGLCSLQIQTSQSHPELYHNSWDGMAAQKKYSFVARNPKHHKKQHNLDSSTWSFSFSEFWSMGCAIIRINCFTWSITSLVLRFKSPSLSNSSGNPVLEFGIVFGDTRAALARCGLTFIGRAPQTWSRLVRNVYRGWFLWTRWELKYAWRRVSMFRMSCSRNWYWVWR